MFCPTCGIENHDKVKFCRRCGAHLGVVLEALQRGSVMVPEPQAQPNPKELAAQALLKKIEETNPMARDPKTGRLILPKLLKELDNLTMEPEERRQKYIRRGMVVTTVGLGLTLFLYLFFGALASTTFIPAEVAPLLRILWIKGLVPVFIGLAIAMYGLLLGKPSRGLTQKPGVAEPELNKATDESLLARPAPFSVTEHTTTRMELPEGQAPKGPVGGRITQR